MVSEPRRGKRVAGNPFKHTCSKLEKKKKRSWSNMSFDHEFGFLSPRWFRERIICLDPTSGWSTPSGQVWRFLVKLEGDGSFFFFFFWTRQLCLNVEERDVIASHFPNQLPHWTVNGHIIRSTMTWHHLSKGSRPDPFDPFIGLFGPFDLFDPDHKGHWRIKGVKRDQKVQRGSGGFHFHRWFKWFFGDFGADTTPFFASE